MTRRPSGFWLVSIALHVVLGAGLLYVITVPGSLGGWLVTEKSEPVPVERIGFLAVPEQQRPAEPGRSGGDGRPVREAPRERRIVAPTEVPSGIPSPDSGAAPAPEGGRGPVVGRGGPLQGITPSYSDPRIWSRPQPFVTGPRTQAEVIREGLRERLGPVRDSLAAVAAAEEESNRRAKDWTFERNGKKYGIDTSKIYLGDITLPSALLALLPINNVQGNQAAIERQRAQLRTHEDIQFQGQRALSGDEFRAAVKRIRERKERERREAEEQKRKQKVQAP
jgi:hypothetical protein